MKKNDKKAKKAKKAKKVVNGHTFKYGIQEYANNIAAKIEVIEIIWENHTEYFENLECNAFNLLGMFISYDAFCVHKIIKKALDNLKKVQNVIDKKDYHKFLSKVEDIGAFCEVYISPIVHAMHFGETITIDEFQSDEILQFLVYYDIIAQAHLSDALKDYYLLYKSAYNSNDIEMINLINNCNYFLAEKKKHCSSIAGNQSFIEAMNKVNSIKKYAKMKIGDTDFLDKIHSICEKLEDKSISFHCINPECGSKTKVVFVKGCEQAA